MLNQVSVFAENNKGALRKMTSVLADANINIYTMLANDSAEFGIIRLIVTDPELAASELRKAGYQCHLDRVVAVEMGDTPGCSIKSSITSARPTWPSTTYTFPITASPAHRWPSSSPGKWKRKPSCGEKAINSSIHSKKKSSYEDDFFHVLL